ncbi:MAG: hypothetical protein LAT61_00375 [Alcanivorax sp.]|nr:hypothetical protein [Alcanivorax sp.]
MSQTPYSSQITLCLLLIVAGSSNASTNANTMRPMSEGEMSSVSGRDGIAVLLNSSGIAIESIAVHADEGTADAGVLRARNITYTPLEPNATWFTATLDVGTDPDGDVRIAYNADMAATRFRLGSLDLGHASQRFGEWVLDATTAFRISNHGLFAHTAPDTGVAALYLSLTDAALFYHPTGYADAGITLAELDFLWDMPTGVIGLSNDGLHIAGDVNYGVSFDWLYKHDASQTDSAVTTTDRPLLQLGWRGMLYDTDLTLGSGGVWQGNEVDGAVDQSARTEGLHMNISWNYRKHHDDPFDPENHMRWRLGHAGQLPGESRMALAFTDWRNLTDSDGNPAEKGFSFPITLDVIPAGSSGPGGLCWGGSTHGSGCEGSMLNLHAGNISGYTHGSNRTDGDGLLFAIRDGNLLAYANQVIVDPDGVYSDPEHYHWGLVYTLPNINANVVMYPGGSLYDADSGFIADILLMSQSSRDGQGDVIWQEGSHFMVVDTCPGAGIGGCDRAVNMGFGMVGADFLFAGDDTRIWLRNNDDGNGGIDLMSPRARMQLRGLLALTRVPDGQDMMAIAGSDLNLEGFANFRITPPPPGEAYLGYSAALRLGELNNTADATLAGGQGSYYAIYEPGRPDVALSFTGITGDVSLEDGRLQVYGRNEKSDGSPPELALSNTIRIGASAAGRMDDAHAGALLPGGAGGQVLRSDVYFGNDRLGEMVIPGATLKSSISLTP